MNRILSLAKYQVRDNRDAALIYYAILIAIALFMMWQAGDDTGTSSITGSSTVFIFVIGLNSFRPSFLFSQANNISRRSFYLATLLALVGLAAALSLADFALDSLMSNYSVNKGLFEQMYVGSSFAKILWTFTLLAFSANVGWMITMFYYRANALVKVLISISPLVLIILASYAHQLTDGRFGNWIWNFFFGAMGFSGVTPNPYTAMVSFSLGTLVVWGINYLLVRRAPVRPY